MLELDNQVKEAVLNGTADMSLEIRVYTDGVLGYEVIPAENITAESMSIEQSISDSEKVVLGGTIAATLEIQLMATPELGFSQYPPAQKHLELEGKNIEVVLNLQSPGDYLYPDIHLFPSPNIFPGRQPEGNSLILFFGKVSRCRRNAMDDVFYNLTAYDPIKQLEDLNVSRQLYSAFIGNNATLGAIINIAVQGLQFDLNDFSAELQPIIYRNYVWEEEKAARKNTTKLNARELLRCVGEICAGFIYYRPNDRKIHLTRPGSAYSSVETCDTYLSLTSEFKKAQSYSVLLFPYAGDITDRGQSGWGNKTGYYPNAGAVEVGDNFPPEAEAMAYDMSRNILAWDYSAARADLNLVKISKIYDVFSTYINSIMNFYSMTVAITGRPWLEIGDVVVVELPVRDVYGRFLDSNGNVTENFDDAQKLTYQTTVFTRTLSGTRALIDKITAKGEN